MIHEYVAEYNRIKLIPLSEDNIEPMRVLRNKYKDCFVYDTEISEPEQIKWYEKYKNTKNDYMFSIFHIEKAIFVGVLALYDVDLEKKQAEFGRIVVDKERVQEKNIGYEATVCACKIGFAQLNLEVIKLEVFEYNIPAKKIYEKAGFSIVGKIENEDKQKVMLCMELKKEEFLFDEK